MTEVQCRGTECVRPPSWKLRRATVPRRSVPAPVWVFSCGVHLAWTATDAVGGVPGGIELVRVRTSVED